MWPYLIGAAVGVPVGLFFVWLLIVTTKTYH